MILQIENSKLLKTILNKSLFNPQKMKLKNYFKIVNKLIFKNHLKLINKC